jgi:acyl-CoA thioesterase
MTYALDESTPVAMAEDGTWHSATSPLYANRVGPYGGWIAALLAKALHATKPHGDLLQINVSFLGPCKDGPLTGRTRLLRAGRSVEFREAEFADSEHPVAHAVATFGVRRPSIAFGELTMPADIPQPEDLPKREIPGGPGFFNRIEARQFGFTPFAHNETTRSQAWVRDSDLRPLDAIALIAHADSPIPRSFLKLERPGVSATLSMNVFLHAKAADITAVGSGFIFTQSEARAGHDGIHDQVTSLWRRDGLLLATSEQLVWFKAGS